MGEEEGDGVPLVPLDGLQKGRGPRLVLKLDLWGRGPSTKIMTHFAASPTPCNTKKNAWKMWVKIEREEKVTI